jgi:hypothetical protein
MASKPRRPTSSSKNILRITCLFESPNSVFAEKSVSLMVLLNRAESVSEQYNASLTRFMYAQKIQMDVSRTLVSSNTSKTA